jgi:membrane associated rhomboid family serine protease
MGETARPTTCYRHPDRRSGVTCQRCDRPICPSCMNQASVGFHCPSCLGAGGRQRVLHGRAAYSVRPVVTQALIGINVAVWVLSLARGADVMQTGGRLFFDLALFGPSVRYDDEYYRIITSGFMHSGLLHLGLNMYALWIIGGGFLERQLGSLRFAVLYAAGLVAGSLGVLVLEPRALTVGASGAVFAMFGAGVLAQRAQGINPWQSGLAGLILLNLVVTFAFPGISIGGHLGGLVGGFVVGALLIEGPRVLRDARLALVVSMAAVPALFVAAIWAADRFATI